MIKRCFSLSLAILLLLASLGGCASSGSAAQVAATTLPVYQFTAALCQGTPITVTRLVAQSVSCLHDYSLNVSQVRAVEAAQVVVISGGGLEEFMQELLPTAEVVIDSSEGISLLESGHHHHEEAHDHHHHHEADAHIWLSPVNAKQMASNICQGLSLQYPAQADIFRKNLESLHARLDRLYEYGRQRLSDLSCRELITFHDGFGYLAQAFDLQILEAIEEESGSEASAQELKHLVELVREHQLPAVFTERSSSASAAQIICAEAGIGSYTLDMAMAGEDYFEAMYHNIDTIKEALG